MPFSLWQQLFKILIVWWLILQQALDAPPILLCTSALGGQICDYCKSDGFSHGHLGSSQDGTKETLPPDLHPWTLPSLQFWSYAPQPAKRCVWRELVINTWIAFQIRFPFLHENRTLTLIWIIANIYYLLTTCQLPCECSISSILPFSHLSLLVSNGSYFSILIILFSEALGALVFPWMLSAASITVSCFFMYFVMELIFGRTEFDFALLEALGVFQLGISLC